ncbi:hypothetical protein HYFRA_00004235 [Hymenoscyphus fraxineus]|uniref:Membrane anchor Opy2 N-terminal domain-containing protein n=1 Tax=Hymenoscyphus fraxineus TaxID=746836 RepID=A0A9N9KMX4_9HELO|nr:hypothetical protein HYFRA_00004235 [Hymenoscyphus fraxineus]
MAYVFEPAQFGSLFRRCVSCDENAVVSCPESCDKGLVCGQIPLTCDVCQHTACVEDPNASTSTLPSSPRRSPNGGAIAGGVIGGLAVIAIATYLVWRFCIKTKRQQYEQDNWVDEQDEQTQAEKDFTMRRDARASTHTVGSIASTVLTRASNIIQIAYIPGVTNRSNPSTPGLLVPPVPPIPIALSAASSPYEQEHFFMPGDLTRDSTYSGVSDARTSYARNSVASTIYGKNAVVSPVPAQTVIRGKAAVVSVKSNGAAGETTPPVPSVDFNKYGPVPPSPAFSVGSTFLNSANTATQVKPLVVRVPNKKQSQNTLTAYTTSEYSAGRPQEESLLDRESQAITIIDDTPTMYNTPNLQGGPFRDPIVPRVASTSSLSAMTTRSKESRAEKSTPFGDEHKIKD